jgi:hypothetical protein
MSGMFLFGKFNGDLSKWKVMKNTNVEDMFKDSPLEKNPPAWYKGK